MDASAEIVHGIVEQLETTQKDILIRLQEQLDSSIADNWFVLLTY